MAQYLHKCIDEGGKSELRVDDLVLSLGSFPFPGYIEYVTLLLEGSCPRNKTEMGVMRSIIGFLG